MSAILRVDHSGRFQLLDNKLFGVAELKESEVV